MSGTIGRHRRKVVCQQNQLFLAHSKTLPLTPLGSEGDTCFFLCFQGLWKLPLSGLYIFSASLFLILINFSSMLNFLVKKRATSKQSQTSAARFELPFYSYSSFLFRSAILCHSISFYFRFSFLALPLGRTSQKRKHVLNLTERISSDVSTPRETFSVAPLETGSAFKNT